MSSLADELKELLEDNIPSIALHAPGIAALVEQSMWLDDKIWEERDEAADEAYKDGLSDGREF